jgi:hypothetical protein
MIPLTQFTCRILLRYSLSVACHLSPTECSPCGAKNPLHCILGHDPAHQDDGIAQVPEVAHLHGRSYHMGLKGVTRSPQQ